MGKHRIAVGILLLVVLLLLGACAPAREQPPSEKAQTPEEKAPPKAIATRGSVEGMIAFETAGNMHIINPDGSNENRLTSGGLLVWAPNAKKIAYLDNYILYVINADGTGKIKVIGPKEGEPLNVVSDYSWSPDGERILFVRGNSINERDDGIWVVNADGSNMVRLLENGRLNETTGLRGLKQSPAFSPDGKKIAYWGMDNVGGMSSLYIMNPDGSGKLELVGNMQFPVTTAWSPDGKKIAYWVYSDLYVLTIDSSERIELSSEVTGFAWSPDGKKIAFGDSDLDSLIIANPDGTGKTTVAKGGFSPSWSPDGRSIVFAVGDFIYLVNADGSGLTKLAPGMDPKWSPR